MFRFICLFLTLSISLHLGATDTYTFSLQFKKNISNKIVKNYFQMIENSLSLGVRLGTNRPINIEFSPAQPLSLECSNENLPNFTHPDPDQDVVFINQAIVQLVEKDSISKRNKHCSYSELLIQSLEASISSLKGAYDFSKPYSKDLKSKVDQCRLDQFMHTNKQDGIYEPTIQGCIEVLALDNKKLKYRKLKKDYEKKLLYMDGKEKIILDTSSLSQEGLQKFNVCSKNYIPDLYTSEKNQPIKILGFAIVYMAPAYRSSQFGHVAERYIYCIENRMVDVLYDYSRLGSLDFADIKNKYKEQLNLNSPNSSISKDDELFLKSLIGKNYIRTYFNPASALGYGSIQLYNNRDIIEVWLNVHPQVVYDNYLKSFALYKKQKELVEQRNAQDWPDYQIISNNCAIPVKEKLNAIGGEYAIDDFTGFLPELIFNFLKKQKTDKIIIYPGQRTLRQYEMLNAGKPLTFENMAFISTTLNPQDDKFVLIQPDYRGFEGIFLNRGASIINFLSGLVETSWGIVTSPLELFVESKNIGTSRIQKGLKNTIFSLTEFFGIVRGRHPAPSDFSPQELDYIKNVIPLKEPVILSYLYSKM